jgi:hypothetical protein
MNVRVKHKIYNKPVLDKLGVKTESNVTVVGVDDKKFLEDLIDRALNVMNGMLRKNAELIFFGADGKKELTKLKQLKRYLKPDGAIWVVSKKGKEATIKEVDVIAAAKAAGLVDNKVVGFSETHTALRLVIPREKR